MKRKGCCEVFASLWSIGEFIINSWTFFNKGEPKPSTSVFIFKLVSIDTDDSLTHQYLLILINNNTKYRYYTPYYDGFIYFDVGVTAWQWIV